MVVPNERRAETAVGIVPMRATLRSPSRPPPITRTAKASIGRRGMTLSSANMVSPLAGIFCQCRECRTDGGTSELSRVRPRLQRRPWRV